MNRNIIVLFPTWPEAKPFMERYGDRYEVGKAGVGLAECAARTSRIISTKKPDLLILAGIAGAYENSGLKKGETVLVLRENSADLGSMQDEIFRPLAKSGHNPADNYYDCDVELLPDFLKRVKSNSVNIAHTENLNREFSDAQIENMEGAAFFAVCEANGVKCAEIRGISNYVGQSPINWDIPGATRNLAENLNTFIERLS